MRLNVLAGFDPHTLRPLSKAQVARRQQIRERMYAKAAEAHLPADEQRGVWDVREFVTASKEVAVACACAAPVAIGIVLAQLL